MNRTITMIIPVMNGYKIEVQEFKEGRTKIQKEYIVSTTNEMIELIEKIYEKSNL